MILSNPYIVADPGFHRGSADPRDPTYFAKFGSTTAKSSGEDKNSLANFRKKNILKIKVSALADLGQILGQVDRIID